MGLFELLFEYHYRSTSLQLQKRDTVNTIQPVDATPLETQPSAPSYRDWTADQVKEWMAHHGIKT